MIATSSYHIQLTDDFGATWLFSRTYTGETAREDARTMARYIRNEMHRSSYIDRGTDRRVSDVRVVLA